MITPDATVGSVLDAHPELVDVLAAYHPHFERLRNRLLRKVMGPRVTLAQAARMAGVPPAELLGALRRAVGEPEPTAAPEPEAAPEAPAGPRLAELTGLRSVVVDVRDDIRRGVEPFARIMAAVKALAGGEALLLRTPFEPVPLYEVLGKRGLAHWTERHAEDDWFVFFYRDDRAAPSGVAGAAPARGASSPVRRPRTSSKCERTKGSHSAPRAGAAPATPDGVLDVRGLEPPQPMLRVLERAEALAPGQAFVVVHDRRPLFLYPQLDDRGFVYETTNVGPGEVRITIQRPRP